MPMPKPTGAALPVTGRLLMLLSACMFTAMNLLLKQSMVDFRGLGHRVLPVLRRAGHLNGGFGRHGNPFRVPGHEASADPGDAAAPSPLLPSSSACGCSRSQPPSCCCIPFLPLRLFSRPGFTAKKCPRPAGCAWCWFSSASASWSTPRSAETGSATWPAWFPRSSPA